MLTDVIPDVMHGMHNTKLAEVRQIRGDVMRYATLCPSHTKCTTCITA